MEQVEQNLVSAASSSINLLPPEADLRLFDEVRIKYQELSPIDCTECEYCLPCPEGVAIPRNLKNYNEGIMYDKLDAARGGYSWIAEEERAAVCIQCLECEQLCPQSIPISDWMVHIHQVLGEGKAIEDVPRP
jgi:predicted aldo/keto reductase-like oxidoreductase